MSQDRQAESRFFDELAARRHFDEFSRRSYAVLLREMLADVPRGARVLDAGCGSGAWLEALASAGWQATGIDLSSGELAQARGRGLPVVVGDLLALPYAPRSFHAVVLCGVLHHFPSASERAQLLRTAHSVLRAGGTLASLDPNGSNPFVRLGFKLHREVSPNEVCLPIPAILAAYRDAGVPVASVRTLEITQPRAPEGPLRAVWPALRRAALAGSRFLGPSASGNYTIVRAIIP